MRISDWSSDVCASDLKAWIPLSDGSRRIRFPILELNSIALANFAFVMAVNTANSILMSIEIFNAHAAARQPRPGSRHGLCRELLTMLVRGPAGATDQVHWSRLLRDRPAAPLALKAGWSVCAQPGGPRLRDTLHRLL